MTNLPLHRQYRIEVPTCAVDGVIVFPATGMVDGQGWVYCQTCQKWWHPDSEHAYTLTHYSTDFPR